MAFVNDSKNTSTVTNDAIASAANLTWNDMTQSWDNTEGTWDNPREAWARDSKNTSTVTNDVKL